MRIFLTGSSELEWRWNIGGFLREQCVEVFDAVEYPREFASLFKYFKILEGCDGVIACFSGIEPQHLQTVLQISYASKLNKEILIVAQAHNRKSWIHTLPYSLNFSDLEDLKAHLSMMMAISPKEPRLFG
jgi:hypothetical protein